MRCGIGGDVIENMRRAEITEKGLDLDAEGLKRPSATWTYIVTDDPFRDQLGVQLAGNVGFAAAAVALPNLPLIILWAVYNRYFKR